MNFKKWIIIIAAILVAIGLTYVLLKPDEYVDPQGFLSADNPDTTNNLALFVVIGLLVLLAGLFNGIMDSISVHYNTSFAAKLDPLFWNPNESWKNKWVTDNNGEPIKPLKPKFFGSSTFLVAFTDAWHLFKMLMMAMLRVTIVLLLVKFVSIELAAWIFAILAYAGLWGIQAVGFHIFYTLIKTKNNE